MDKMDEFPFCPFFLIVNPFLWDQGIKLKSCGKVKK